MADQPTTMRGYVDEFIDTEMYGAALDLLLETDMRLVWPMTIDTFSRMRLEPSLIAIRKVYDLAARRANWSIDGTGCRDEVTQLTADDLGLPIKGVDDVPTGARRRNFLWADHLRLALLCQDFGHMFFEQDYVEQAGRWRLNTVQERMPQTVAELKLNPDGTLAAVVQKGRMRGTGIGQPIITTADHRLVYYVNDREGANYFGRSVLRPAFPLWVMKNEVMRVHATSIRRFGLGIPGMEAPAGATPQQIAEGQRTIGAFKASEHAGLAVPNGWKATLTGLTGNVPDAVAFLTYLDRQMTRYSLTSLLDMATSERGSRALGETVMDVMVYAQQAVADFMAETGTTQIVVPLVDANWGEDEPAPRICVGDVGADLELTAQDVFWLTAYGALTPEPEMQNFLRSRYGIPTLDPAALAEMQKQAAAAVASGAGRLPFAYAPPIPPTGGADR